jgi:hypothetical protein
MLVGKRHKIIPQLEKLYNLLRDIEEMADGMNLVNYGGRAQSIRVKAQDALGEINRVVTEDAK